MRFSAKTETGDVGIQAKINAKYARDDFARQRTTMHFVHQLLFLSCFVSLSFESRSMATLAVVNAQ